jgi:hypothetical protein
MEASYDIEHRCEYHTDSDGVGNVRKEEDGLKESIKELNRVKRYGDNQRKNGGDQNRGNAKNDSILQASQEMIILKNVDEVAKSYFESSTAKLLHSAVILKESHTNSIYDRPTCEYEKKHNGRRKV